MLLSLRSLKAVRLFASDEQTRFYLCGVRAEVRADDVTYVATNGHGLIACRDVMCGGGDVAITIPSAVIDSFKLSARERNGDNPLPCELSKRDDGLWELRYGDVRVAFEAVGGAFPDWRRVVPSEVNHKPACYNPDYLVIFNKADAMLRGDRGHRASTTLSMNGGGPALIAFEAGQRAFGVLMPIRCAAEMTNPPAWFTAPSRAQEMAA